MKIDSKVLVYIFTSIAGVMASMMLYSNKHYNYTIIAVTLTFVIICLTIRYILNNRSDLSIYKSKVRYILKTYDSVLIKSNELPDIEEKNVVEISSIEDLIDAQIELKKPIYFKEFEDYTVFILIDNDEACVSTIKLNPNATCAYEESLSEMRNRKNNKNIDKSFLDDLENTTIIRLENNREFKVSPIKNKKYIELTPSGCMINKDKICLILKDDTRTTIAIDSINDVVGKYDKKKLIELAIITDDSKYVLKDLNEAKMLRIKDEIKKRLAN